MAVKKWATTNGTVWSFNGSIVTSLVDSENPQGIPPSTIRLKFSDPTFNPSNYTYPSVPSGNANISWTQVSSEPNVWDGCYPPYASGVYTTWQGLFQGKFNDHTNTVEVVGANLDRVTDVNLLFKNCSSLLSVGTIDFGTAVNCDGMFSGCSNLRTVGDIIILGDDIFDDHNTHIGFTRVGSMFENCTSLTTVGNVRLEHMTSMEYMFDGCRSLTTIGNVYAPKVVNLAWAFHNCESLVTMPSVTLSNLARIFYSSFNNCRSLQSCPIVSSLDNATNCENMFNNCHALSAFPTFSASKVTTIASMFYGCDSLTGSIPSYDFRNVNDCKYAFAGCTALSGGILDTYDRFMSYEIQPTVYTHCFQNCGIGTQTGSAELAQIPSDWK